MKVCNGCAWEWVGKYSTHVAVGLLHRSREVYIFAEIHPSPPPPSKTQVGAQMQGRRQASECGLDLGWEQSGAAILPLADDGTEAPR